MPTANTPMMVLSYPNDSTTDAAPNKIEHDYESGEQTVQMGKNASYEHMMGTPRAAHHGSQSKSPAKE